MVRREVKKEENKGGEGERRGGGRERGEASGGGKEEGMGWEGERRREWGERGGKGVGGREEKWMGGREENRVGMERRRGRGGKDQTRFSRDWGGASKVSPPAATGKGWLTFSTVAVETGI
ncbi:hypothetical protein NHX12_033441 [Muraenolepis orangiensis]|uniref:Uncharacterized protein n=1 Tax=Muraenolepis orangiensis TaxID=630683 RepID=A0A9Q0E606_9TELE|nr:hypothetical protein NHX12_033441 [Muraenolepis orangiensis]